MMSLFKQIVSLCMLLHSCEGVFNINDFNALENVDTWAAAVQNTEALHSAIVAANSSTDDRTVWIPTNSVFYIKNVTLSYLHHITIVVDGTLRLNNDLIHWKHEVAGKKEEALYFADCEGIHITGTGVIDGQGLAWWRLAYLGIDYRPHFIEFYQGMLLFVTTLLFPCQIVLVTFYCIVRDIAIDTLLITNAPSWSVVFKDCADIVVHDITIFIDSSITRHWNGTHESVTYPLNTDGIDIQAHNVTIYNVNMTNYDDAFVPKPCRSTWKYCQCSGE
jgi:polygalacturonase